MAGLSIQGLSVRLSSRYLLHDVHLRVEAGEAVALVGESGSGKSTLLRACLGLLPAGMAAGGRIEWCGSNLLEFKPAAWRRVRGREVGWIPQEPSAALDPRRTAAQLLTECGGSKAIWAQVGLEAAQQNSYPHEWSGGMQQRLLVAMALARFAATGERLLLADEPTSALDPLHQARLLELLHRLRQEAGFGLLLVTHDLAVAAAATSRAYVLHQGSAVEEGATTELFLNPRHAVTAAMVAAQPRWAVPA
ncbi:MAG TPA: ATP-binding cassette domain-containing protein [Terriglobales bacterium]|nr:ATP-binding cassette domain-containing protein [Terriglobales bacterium]